MKEFDTAQVEQLKTIGEYLYRERQERAISLDEIAVKTYIPLRLLEALELGHVDRLPEPVFVQGFIRRYAEAIGLDGQALAKTFSPQDSFVVERKPELERPHTLERPVEEPRQVTSDRAPRAGRSYLPLVLLGTAAALLLGVGVVSLLNRPKLDTDAQTSATAPQPSPVDSAPLPTVSAPSKTTSSSVAAVSPSPNPVAQPDETPTAPPVAANSPIQVAVNLTGDSWLQIIADGKTEFEGILKKGDQKTWSAQKKLVLQSGNAGAVSVSYNQGEAKPLGALGEVKDVTYPSNPKTKPDQAN